MRTKLCVSLVAAALLLPVQNAHSELIPYSLVLQVTSVDPSVDVAACEASIARTFPCNVAPGDIFTGSFNVDASLLSMEGLNLTAPIFDFFLQIGEIIWDQDHPSDFYGFGGPSGIGGVAGIGAFAPGFDVHNGILTGLEGGVYGSGDSPFVDFPPFVPAGTFSAYSSFGLSGEMLVGRRLPEPGSLSLLALVLAGVGITHRKRAVATHRVRAIAVGPYSSSLPGSRSYESQCVAFGKQRNHFPQCFDILKTPPT